jgi:hypothetical protein
MSNRRPVSPRTWNHSSLRRSGVVACARNTGRRLVVAANLLTQLGPMPAGVTMGAQLASSKGGWADRCRGMTS